MKWRTITLDEQAYTKESRDELVLVRPMPEPSKPYGSFHRQFPKPNEKIVPSLMRRHKKRWRVAIS